MSKIEENASLVQTVRFYYPNASDTNTISTIDKDIYFKTNEKTETKLEEGYKSISNPLIKTVLSNGAAINSLRKTEDTVTVDLNEAFQTEMDTACQDRIIQCIVNTVGRYYALNQVVVTVENVPIKNGEIQTVNEDSITANL